MTDTLTERVGQTTPATHTQEPATEGKAPWSALWILAGSLAMIVLDGTIVAVALPTIIQDLHLDLTDAQWVNSLYSVVFAALLLSSGKLGDRFGRRRMLMFGLAAFVTGSVLAALSGSAASLLLARVVQGVGGAMVLPATLSSVNATFRGKDRAAAFGVWGAVMAGAAAIGPLLGGILTEYSTWQMIFWVNVPVGLVLIGAALKLVPETRADDPSAPKGADVPGFLLSAAGFALIVFGLIEGSSLGWWSPKAELNLFGLTWPADAPISAVPVTIAAGVVLIAAFVAWEWRTINRRRGTVLDLRLFRIPTFSLGNVTAMLVAVGEFSLLFVLPLYLVNSLQLSTLNSGFVVAAMAGGAFLSGAAARHLAAAIGPTRVVILGLAREVAGVALTAIAVGGMWSGWGVALVLLPYGLGLGLASAQLTSTTLRDVPVAESGAGSATQSTVRQLGSALGSAIGGTTLATALTNAAGASAAAAGSAGAPGAIPADTFAGAASTSVWASAVVLVVALGSSVLVDLVSRRH